MGKIRCYLPPQEWLQSKVRICGREAQHLIRVLRVNRGTQVTCFDGQGHEAQGTVERIAGRDLFLELESPSTIPFWPWAVTLGVGIPKHGKLDQVVDQATQLGVRQIIPLSTARGVVKIPAETLAIRQTRWRQIAVEAAKQSGMNYLPEIHSMTSWEQLLPLFIEYDLILLATLPGPHRELTPLLHQQNVQKVLLLIGPEGDFTEGEIRQAVQAGAHRISLGATTLRTETAAIVAVGLVSFLLREAE